jgi:hypothetical protein
MSIYWNSFTIIVVNNTNTNLTWGGVNPLNGTVQTGVNVPKGTTVTACTVQSWSDSTSGASGTANWSTDRDNVLMAVQFSAPNTGDPSGVPLLSGAGKTNYSYTSTLSSCSGSGCPINSGYRSWTLTVTLSPASS